MTGFLVLVAAAVVLALAYAALAGTLSSKELAAIATLAAVASAGRVAFAAMPSVQPTTVIVLLTGFVFGPGAGFVAGATAGVVSNVFLGQGPWTVWQMLSWGLVGSAGGLLGRLRPKAGTPAIALVAAACGLAFSWLMDLWFWASFVYPHTWASLAGVFAASFAFDVLHAVGNVAFAWVLAGRLVTILARFRDRLTVVYEPGLEGEAAPRDPSEAVSSVA